MNDSAADNSGPAGLASMLEVDWAGGRLWEEQDLAAVLRHQLASPRPGGGGHALDASTGEVPTRLETFGQLLNAPSPPVALLVAAKDFAKAARMDPHATLPKEIAAVLYFAAIVVARRRCGTMISRLSQEELRAGVEWVIAQPWVDPATRDLFRQVDG